MEDFLIRYGLLALFAGAALEGDITAILAGVVAHLGFFSLPAAIAVTGIGGTVADCGCYALGRTQAAAMRDTAIYRRVRPFIEQLTARVGTWEITLARFVFGTRVASMLFWGMARLPFARFALLDLVGCALWAVAFVSLGYAFSGSAAMLIGDVKRAERWLLIALLLIAAVIILMRRLMRARLPSRRHSLR